MFGRSVFILNYWVYWLLFFALARIFFLLGNYAETAATGLSLAMRSMFYGLRMDMSMATYISLPVALLVLCSVFFNWAGRPLMYKIYTGIILALLLMMLFADLGLYKAWGTRLDATPLKYLANPKEVWASVAHLPVFGICLLFIMLLIALIFAANRMITYRSAVLLAKDRKLFSFLSVILLIALFIVPLRGGFQLAPLNQSSVYFSQNNFANMAAVNAPWNLMYALNHNADNKTNPFLVTAEGDAAVVVDSFFIRSENTQPLLDRTKNPRPNVILITWESLTGKAIGMRKGGLAVLPGIEKLVTEGVYFSNIYASGDRTDKGIVAILSGFPAQPTTSIVKIPGKAARLPMLSKIFHDSAYHTSFYYGGELAFANMKAYLLQGSFDKFISVEDFDKKDQNSKWGAHDGVVMQRWLKDLNSSKQPFFSNWLTLSSHEPYEIPARPVFAGKDDVSQFLSSLHYTDSIVYQFIGQAKQQPWWSNTIVIIVADHGHRLLSTGKKADDFKIPLLVLGGALNKTGIIFREVGGQTDLAATLLAQLGYPSKQFRWSKNLADSSSRRWAYFTFNNGFGFVQPGKRFVFDNVGKIVIEKEGDVTDQDIFRGRMLQQLTFQDYLNK